MMEQEEEPVKSRPFDSSQYWRGRGEEEVKKEEEAPESGEGTGELRGSGPSLDPNLIYWEEPRLTKGIRNLQPCHY